MMVMMMARSSYLSVVDFLSFCFVSIVDAARVSAINGNNNTSHTNNRASSPRRIIDYYP